MDPRVLDVLQRVQQDVFGNASSSSHSFGWAAEETVRVARRQVADLVGADPTEIHFTSGATEANNLALLGVAAASAQCRTIITTALEHSSILQPLDHLEKQGWRVLRLPCRSDGLIDPQELGSYLDKNTALVTVTTAQNEIGTLQPVADVGHLCRRQGVLFHTDAAQGAVHAGLNVQKMEIDLLSLSGHKIYGPKGVGALWIRRARPKLLIDPVSFGGGQENGIRPGTLNVPGIAAFGDACRLALAEGESEKERLGELKARFLERLGTQISDFHLNGAAEPRLPGNLNLRFDGVRAGQLMPRLTVLALSAGSACRSREPGPSPVLLALGLSRVEAESSLRIGLGRFTTAEEVDFAADRIAAVVTRTRQENA